MNLKLYISFLALLSQLLTNRAFCSTTLYNRTDCPMSLSSKIFTKHTKQLIDPFDETIICVDYYNNQDPYFFVFPANFFKDNETYSLYLNVKRSNRSVSECALYDYLREKFYAIFPNLLSSCFKSEEDFSTLSILSILQNSAEASIHYPLLSYSMFHSLQATRNYPSHSLSAAIALPQGNYGCEYSYGEAGINKSNEIIQIINNNHEDPLKVTDIFNTWIESNGTIPQMIYKKDASHNLPIEPFLLNLKSAKKCHVKLLDILGMEIKDESYLPENVYGLYIKWEFEICSYKQTPLGSSSDKTSSGKIELGLALGYSGSTEREALCINHFVYKPKNNRAKSILATLSPTVIAAFEERKDALVAHTQTPESDLKARSQKKENTHELPPSKRLKKTKAGLTPTIERLAAERLNLTSQDPAFSAEESGQTSIPFTPSSSMPCVTADDNSSIFCVTAGETSSMLCVTADENTSSIFSSPVNNSSRTSTLFPLTTMSPISKCRLGSPSFTDGSPDRT